jgi:Flp pilus assembly protein TadD
MPGGRFLPISIINAMSPRGRKTPRRARSHPPSTRPAAAPAAPLPASAALAVSPLQWLRDHWQVVALWAALVAVTLASYYPAWHGAPLWDDEAHMTPAGLRSIEGLRRIWFEVGASQQYYPIVHSAFWVMHRLWGDVTTGYHLVNILLHATSACLIAVLLGRLNIAGGLLAAFAFALHPVHVESVAWITELKNTLSTALYLGAALCYLRFDETRRRERWRWALGLFALALGSKTVTATLPAALLVVAWWKYGRISWRRDVQPLVPFFLLAVAAGAMTSWVEYTFIGARGTEFHLGPIERVLLAGRAVWFYLSSLVWPLNLVFIYPRWQLSAAVWWQYLFPLALAGALSGFWMVRHRTRAPLAGVLLYVIGLAPALGFVNVYPFRYSFVADHFQYLASIPMFALLAAALTTAAVRWIPLPPVRVALAAATLVPLSVLTWQTSRQYVDPTTLFESTIARNPSAWMAHISLAAHSLSGEHPNPDEAYPHLQAALAANPQSAEVQNALGLFFQHQGRLSEARQAFEAALRVAPGLAGPHNNLGVLAYMDGRLEEAAQHYREAIRLDPRDPEPRRNLAIVLSDLGQSGAPAAALRDVLGADRDAPAALERQAREALEGGRAAEAATHFEALRHLRPADALVRVGLGAAYEAQGQLDVAASHYREALRLDPRSPEARDALGYVLVRQGQFAEAVPHLTEAVRLRPDFGPSHASLAGALREVGKIDESIAAYRRALEFRENAMSADVRNNYGIALALGGRSADAAAEFREALRLNPNLADARTNLQVLERQ